MNNPPYICVDCGTPASSVIEPCAECDCVSFEDRYVSFRFMIENAFDTLVCEIDSHFTLEEWIELGDCDKLHAYQEAYDEFLRSVQSEVICTDESGASFTL